jgi:acetoin utilization protein AcuB
MKKTIGSVMTKYPFSISASGTVGEAGQLMREKEIRHLPVMEGEEVVGVLSERDLRAVGKFPRYEAMRVSEVMSPDPFVVGPDALFSDVAQVMAQRKYGSVVVVDGPRPVGIFTAVDALMLMAAAYR